jgi:LPXTG-site transpeptidase (sortase) family protein
VNNARRLLFISRILTVAGSLLILFVGGLYAYGRFTAWVITQPRALTSAQMVWPDVPPLTPLPTSTPLPTPAPTPTLLPQPPVWIEIPKLGIERTVVPLRTAYQGEKLVWDVESLFATQSRRDLVGHLMGTSNPGERGNIVLTGHNYNWGLYNWTAVFYSLPRLAPGDLVHLLNESDERFTYQVERVEQIPWRAGPDANRLEHLAYLSPTQDETLTLVTCVGANVPFDTRLYVTAKRINIDK